MAYAFKFFILTTAVFHCLFFKLESLDFLKDKTIKIFGLKREEAVTISKWAYNQGFYNLFLSFGLFYSLFLLGSDRNTEGLILARYILLFIVGAGIILFKTAPKKISAAMIQALPALVGFTLSFYST